MVGTTSSRSFKFATTKGSLRVNLRRCLSRNFSQIAIVYHVEISDAFDAPDLAAQQKVAEAIQLLTWEDAPFFPLGQGFQPIARRNTVSDIVRSPFPLFWNAKKTG